MVYYIQELYFSSRNTLTIIRVILIQHTHTFSKIYITHYCVI